MVTTHNLGLAKTNIRQSRNQSQLILPQHQQQETLDFVSVACTGVSDPMVTMMDLLGHQSQHRHFKAYKEAQWFNSNQHYVVPEITQNTRFNIDVTALINEVTLVKQQGLQPKPIIIGPISYLWFAEAQGKMNKLDLLDSLLPVYAELLQALSEVDVEWVQFDEPVLTQALDQDWKYALTQTYFHLQRSPVKKLLASTLGKLGDNLGLLRELNIDGIHLDTISAEDEALKVTDWLPNYKIISLAVVDGCNSTATDIEDTLAWLRPIHELVGDRLWLAPSCSLAHLSPANNNSSLLDNTLQKFDEIKLLAIALEESTTNLNRIDENNDIDNKHQELEEHKVAA